MKLGDKLVANKYQLGTKLGSGAFGEVYEAIVVKTGERVAAKFEVAKRKRSQLQSEANVYKILQGKYGIPKLYCFCSEGGYNIMIMQLLGDTLESQCKKSGGKLPQASCFLIGEQMVRELEEFHEKSLIHRDVKPDNFAKGLTEEDKIIYIFDYGLVKRYCHPRTHKHIPYRDGKNITGTVRFASINTHLGIEQSRRDDIECMMYTVIYLARGELPWQGVKAVDKKDKYTKIMKIKMEGSVQQLCLDLPQEIVQLIYYCRSLGFEEKPDYEKLKHKFRFLAQHKALSDTKIDFKPTLKLPIAEAKAKTPVSKKIRLLEEEKEKHSFSKKSSEKSQIEQLSELDDIIPSEHPLHTAVVVPKFNFVSNERHWRRYKVPCSKRGTSASPIGTNSPMTNLFPSFKS